MVVAIGALAIFALVSSGRSRAGNVYRDLELLGQTLTIVRDSYVDEVDIGVLLENALRGMVDVLDQHSTYLDTEDLRLLREEAEGKFGGLGIVVGMREGVLTVVAPLDGSPAQAGGLRPGDRLVEIDGLTTFGMSLRSAIARLRGRIGAPVELTINRPGVTTNLSVEITREEIEVPNVPYAFHVVSPTGKRVGYLRLAAFTEKTSAVFRAALEQLLSQECEGLVIDLRGNPGGLLSQAVEVADLLLPQGAPVCYTVGRRGSQTVEYWSKNPAVIGDLPLVGLIDGGMASGAEIVASALQSNANGVLLGNTSFGKGTVQELRDLGDGTAIKITTGRWFTPEGFCVDVGLGVVDSTRASPGERGRVGVDPNIEGVVPEGGALALDLASGLAQAFVDSFVGAAEEMLISPESFRPGDELVESLASWIEHASTLSMDDPDSAALLATQVREEKAHVARYVGTEVARRRWGNEGAARFVCHADSVVIRGISLVSDAEAYQIALHMRATNQDSTAVHLHEN